MQFLRSKITVKHIFMYRFFCRLANDTKIDELFALWNNVLFEKTVTYVEKCKIDFSPALKCCG